MNPTAIAESATVHSFLNCYLRETGDYEVVDAADTPAPTRGRERVVRAPLPEQGITLFVPLRYRSPTDRHLFDLPGYYRRGDRTLELDYVTLASLVTEELSLARDDAGNRDELLLRVIRSCKNVARFVEARRDDTDRLYGFDTTFREAEQSLVFGHLLHPTPKSRQGIPPHESPTYAPELEGSFSLHYFRADPDLVWQDSALGATAEVDAGSADAASEWVKSALREDPAVPESFVAAHVESDDVLIPVHPWQADYLLEQDHVQAHLGDGLESLGRVGREFYPTSSVRTLYAPDAPFMVKGSLNVRITNSERTNKRPELDRGVAVAELLDTELGDDLRERFPDFHVVRDPASLTLTVGEGAESGFEVVLRENAFRGADAENAGPVVALCQDRIAGDGSRLGEIIETLAEREGRSTEAVSRDWFRRYLERSLRPILWLYLERGVGVEAHQQNSVLALADGYPDEFYYRDNQGYYFPESQYDDVDALLPGVGERADTVCPDAVADERIRYYVVLNNLFGVVNAFGTAGLADERDLLGILREELERCRRFDRESSSLLDGLLEDATLPCKANLLTRFHDMDELVGSLENQSVYADVTNPLVTETQRGSATESEVSGR
ncbi:IucA/IucC family siderophore biosynthesis protein [Halorussus sp. MSC15.2]|uniref:IucA/IucC family protein n=1 Tax=Halorussus sp. MSC15.2 TaxID=2283638 RepID=UPI0013D07183|nr:IucA/IucC family siderophore biosynthesis protein [Halorussus sp. MSC15.2]NEU57255.1 IucA/IucC family siderophore biosynthesis protein [Halorussus sp. MSC15.2]